MERFALFAGGRWRARAPSGRIAPGCLLAWSERRWAKRADAHITVSKALADWLLREYRVRATVVYDRPAASFVRPSAEEAAALWEIAAKEAQLGLNRPPMIVCPTSWSPDEDFDLVLEALERAERQLSSVPDSNEPSGAFAPALAVFLTGRGPLRASFETRAARRNFKAIAVKTIWLEPADYPGFVGMADLGLCLHQSSSGLDLPMKLADLRGAGVPAAVFDYAPVLSEVITAGNEGVLFRDPGELSNVMVAVARRSITADSGLGRSRAWLQQHPAEMWDAQWNAAARPVLLPDVLNA